MEKEVDINGNRVSYTLKRSRKAKRMRVAVLCDCSIVVTSPQALPENAILKFIKLKSDWITNKITFFSNLDIDSDIAIWSKDHFEKHKAEALKVVQKKVRHYSKKHDFAPNQVRVKMLKTKWGSCSKKGNLNFSYKIIFLPSKLQNYIVLHELCHLREMNHSKRFWSLLSTYVPDYKDLRDELRKIGL